MLAGILVTICVMHPTDGEQCREFTQETTATVAQCEEVIEAYELYIVGQLLAGGLAHILSSVDAQCYTMGEPT